MKPKEELFLKLLDRTREMSRGDLAMLLGTPLDGVDRVADALRTNGYDIVSTRRADIPYYKLN